MHDWIDFRFRQISKMLMTGWFLKAVHDQQYSRLFKWHNMSSLLRLNQLHRGSRKVLFQGHYQHLLGCWRPSLYINTCLTADDRLITIHTCWAADDPLVTINTCWAADDPLVPVQCPCVSLLPCRVIFTLLIILDSRGTSYKTFSFLTDLPSSLKLLICC